ncbi:MAG: trypsin-like serine protease [Bradymonadales bacterium]
MKKIFCLFILSVFTTFSCGEAEQFKADLGGTKHAIFNGIPDIEEAHNAVVALLVVGNTGYRCGINDGFFCTGTLIHESYVLTAAHCVKGYDVDPCIEYMKVGVGKDETEAMREPYEISAFHPHPDYSEYDDEKQALTDIAIIKLARPIPRSVAKPILPLHPARAILDPEIKDSGVQLEFSGFGRTETGSSGVKLKMSRELDVYCGGLNSPADGESGCELTNYHHAPYASFYYAQNDGGPCSGDSGGPAFITRDGVEYVAGVTSYGDSECTVYGVSTSVQDYYSWILEKAPVLKENCSNKVDDNGDGLIDCDDPQCAGSVYCKTEICDNEIDDNANGLIDCDDPQCAGSAYCKTEICNNKIDDNANGLIDCDDPQCADNAECKPAIFEICDNEIDDNANGLIDCQDPQCANSVYCKAEICNNEIDDNADGLIDCDDPQCANSVYCKAEICNNEIDDNADGLIDCDDPQCANSVYCKAEICNNEIDDNADGLIDCNDAQCSAELHCQPEICDNGEDDNGDGRTDCRDPQCSDAPNCKGTGIEICNNKIDDNQNGLIDCDEPSCESTLYCVIIARGKELCGEHATDDNGDGVVNCADESCKSSDKCKDQVPEICNNGIDDNGDGLIDCRDPQCPCTLSFYDCSYQSPQKPASNAPWFLAFFALVAITLRRRFAKADKV